VYLALALTAGVASAVIPTLAIGQSPPSSASFTAVDGSGAYGGATHTWQSNTGGSQATIAPGGTITFSYSTGAPPQGSTMHNVDFSSGPATPACTQTQGPSSGSVPPLPHNPTGPGWAGTCTFNTPGTYSFHCDLHTSMTGTVVVQSGGSGTTTSTSTTSPGPTSTGTTSTPGGSPNPAGPGGAPLRDLVVGSHQHGRVSARVVVGQSGSQFEADLLKVQGTSTVATTARGTAQKVLGKTVKSNVPAGTLQFQVALNRRGRKLLKRQGRLKVVLKVAVTPPGGTTKVASARVTMTAR
jgi:plastocyanin